MYIELAILSLFVFIYSLIAGRLQRSLLSGPIVWVLAGVVMGPIMLGLLDASATRADLRVLADLTLALVLFLDAANADWTILKNKFKIPFRMLLLGLPGAIVLGIGLAVFMFEGLTFYEAAILGTMLAATDAALGKAVITNKAVPAQIREGLNIESGLNDGLCVPFLLVFIALAEGSASGEGVSLALTLVAEEIGIGLAVGLGLTALAGWLIRMCWRRGWVNEIWVQITLVGLAFACFAIADSLHGSGYIAAFCGGLLFGFTAKESKHKLVFPAEGISETLALLTWVVFGVNVVGQSIDSFTWEVLVYALISLTLVRMLPIFLSLTGTGESTPSKLFLGWFGPRGLASIVFAIIVIDANLPGSKLIAMVVVCTVFFSLIAHGISANPLAKWISRQSSS